VGEPDLFDVFLRSNDNFWELASKKTCWRERGFYRTVRKRDQRIAFPVRYE
jgi:hypothetical protein